MKGSAVIAACALLVAGGAAVGQNATGETRSLDRTQTIALKKGWNAIYLEVEPGDPDPGTVFGGLPVDMVATYFASKSSAQFVTDPSVDLFKNLGWAVWYASDRPDAFLTTLDAIYGRRGYLVRAKQDYQWNVSGTAMPEEVVWQADSFNLVGFPVVDRGGPSFAEFFSGSKAHQHNKIYRLVNGAWRRVTNPASEAMKPGEAFWIYCEGASRYRGPLSVETKQRRGLFLQDGAVENLVLRNHTSHPIAATVEHVTPISDPVPLSVVVRMIGDPAEPIRSVSAEKPAGPWTQAIPAIEGGSAIALPFAARRKEMTRPVHGSLLKITTDMGTVSWVPVMGYRKDLVQDQ